MSRGLAIVDYDCITSAGLDATSTWERLADNGSGACAIDRPADAVFGAEERDQRHIRRVLEQINGRPAVPVVAGVIRDQTDAFSFERCEIVFRERVNAVTVDDIQRLMVADLIGTDVDVVVLRAGAPRRLSLRVHELH